PQERLPKGWPGARSAEDFGKLHERLRDAGERFVRG
nr:PaaX family transcriptional regulator C-terminal domain-containing protein [Streptomyces sp. DSM 41633]